MIEVAADEYDKPPLLREVQNIQSHMLKELRDFCESNGIQYFLIGGTALGARRHLGFIPWDDDIDVGMLRADYETFKEKALTNFPDSYFIQTPESESTSPFPYLKIRKRNTRIVEKPFQKIAMHHGVYLDIFPFDRVPDNWFLRKVQFGFVQFLSKLYVRKKVVPQLNQGSSIVPYFKFLLKQINYHCTKYISDRLILSFLCSAMTAFNKKSTEAYSCLFFPSFMVESFCEDVLLPLGEAAFEGEVYPVPGKLDVYLTTHYGDFMKLPPENDRYGHDLDWQEVEL